MTFKDYLFHYLSLPGSLLFVLVSLLIVLGIHGTLLYFASRKARRYRPEDRAYAMTDLFTVYTERYYELMFSATSTLLFTGIYFLINYNYFHMSEAAWAFWSKYDAFILLGLLILSILLINIMDHLIIPLKRIGTSQIGSLRMAGMVYMLLIFAYIKFVDQNSNYDIIIFYFLTMVIGRFVYLDASLSSFTESVKSLTGILPALGLVLLSTALLALYGFSSGYLLRSNGVVVSLFLAHCIVIFEIFLLSSTGVFRHLSRRMSQKLHG